MLKVGILGTANIAHQFVRDAKPFKGVSFTAVASREANKAQAFANQWGIPLAFGSYEGLLASDAIDAVYIPLPNSMHIEWAIKAMQADKHVLCEKPLAVSAQDVQAMFGAAHKHQRILLESYPYWFQPQTGLMMDLIHTRTIGDVQAVHAAIGFTVLKPEGNIRFSAELGGGALLDAGTYPMSLIRLAMGSAPDRVQAYANMTNTGVDVSTIASLVWDDGRYAQLSCAMNVANIRRATIMGTGGTIETEYLNHTGEDGANHPYGYQPSLFRVRKGVANSVPFETIQSPTGSGFYFAAQAFAKLIEDDDFVAMDQAAAASFDIACTLEAITASARTGKEIRLSEKLASA